VAVAGLLLAGLAARLPNFGRPLLEADPFRQTETAYPALIFHLQGINLLAPQLPVLGRPWQVPFEFPLLQAAGALLMDLGVVPDLAMRICGLACFMATAALLWGLVRYLASRLAAVLALVVFLASPFNILWSRTSMIEYLATALALAYVWAGAVWIDRRQGRFAAIAVAAGSLAMLVKPTSAVFWMAPLLLYSGSRPRAAGLRLWLRDRLGAALVLCLVPLAAAAVWTGHADAIKAANPATRWLTSASLVNWNFGPLAERFNLTDWKAVLQPITTVISGLPLWALAAVGVIAVARRRRRAVWLGFVLAAVLPVLTFFNLYLQDYYAAAITPALAAVIGYSWEGIILFFRTRPLRLVVVAALVLSLGGTVYDARDYLAPIYSGTSDPAQVLPATAELDAGTLPHDLIVFEGLDWSPAVPYYARRTGMMLPTEIITPQLLDSLPEQGYAYLFTATARDGAFSSTARAVLARWPWFGYVSAHLLHLGSSYRGVSASAVAVGATSFDAPAGTPSLLPAPVPIECGQPPEVLTLAPGGPITLTLSGVSPTSAIRVGPSGDWIPAEATVVVGPQLVTGGTLTLACTGTASLVVTHAYASAP
jgi:hypothetical protein